MQHVRTVSALPRSLAAVKVKTLLSEWTSQFGRELNKVYEVIGAGTVRKAGHNVMVYYPRTDGMVDIVCGVEIEGNTFDAAGDVSYHETPAGAALTATHVGPYRLLGSTHDAIVERARQEGKALSGICWEIYGDWEEDPSRLHTDVFHLLR